MHCIKLLFHSIKLDVNHIITSCAYGDVFVVVMLPTYKQGNYAQM